MVQISPLLLTRLLVLLCNSYLDLWTCNLETVVYFIGLKECLRPLHYINVCIVFLVFSFCMQDVFGVG